MKGSSNEGQFKKARKQMPDFFKDTSSAKASDKMDKANPKALRLANGGASRQPRSGGMQFVKRETGGAVKPVKRNMGGMMGDPNAAAQRLQPPVDPSIISGSPVMNPPVLGIGRGQPGGRFGNRPMKPAVMPPPEPMMQQPEANIGGEGPGFKRGGAVPRNKAARHSTKEDAADKRADAISARKVGMKPAAFEGTKADERMDRAGTRARLAVGGAGKIRHNAMSESGKPEAAPKGKKLFEAI